jgi:pimeloyl-ACP methyl ester carboxylesterase
MSAGQDCIGHDLPVGHDRAGRDGGDGGSHDELAPPRADGIPGAGILVATPKRTQRPPWERQLLAAATPMRVHAAVSAASWSAGPAVLLVHGWQGRGTQLGWFVEPIVATGRRVVAVDAPGHGDSPVGRFTPVAFAEALLRVQEQTGELDGVVAHSMGAAAVMVALREGLRTASLTLIAPVRSFTDLVRRVGASCGFEPDTPAGAYYLRLAGQLLGRPVADLDLDPVPMGDATVLLCHDSADQTIPVTSTRRLAEAWPHAAFIETTDLGHAAILADPAVISAVVSHINGARSA